MIKEWYIKHKAKQELQKAFKLGEMGITYSYGNTSGLIYPKIHAAALTKDALEYVFTIPTGMDPKELHRKSYCFKQVFGEQIKLKGETKKFILTVYFSSLPSLIRYNLNQFQERIKTMKLPIICGLNMQAEPIAYDMTLHPHLLIAGETGSGKSTQLRTILTALIETKADQMELYLCDLKRSEFHLFKGKKSVKNVSVSPLEILPILEHIRGELRRRGDLLDQHELAHIDDLTNPPPYIVLCIDEVALLKKERDIMDLLEEISAIGRALGVFLILSMQRPDSKLLEGALKNNLTVRMGFKCADLINARVIGTPGSEKLNGDGRMLLKLDGVNNMSEIQAPYLSIEAAKNILEGYKSFEPKKSSAPSKNTNKDDSEIIDAIFEVLD